jgi:hypothetical protein
VNIDPLATAYSQAMTVLRNLVTLFPGIMEISLADHLDELSPSAIEVNGADLTEWLTTAIAPRRHLQDQLFPYAFLAYTRKLRRQGDL